MNNSNEGEFSISELGPRAGKGHGVSPDDSIRSTKPILEDSIRGALSQMTDEDLNSVLQWSTAWTQDVVSAVKRWVARGPIEDEIHRRRQEMLRAGTSAEIEDKKKGQL